MANNSQNSISINDDESDTNTKKANITQEDSTTVIHELESMIKSHITGIDKRKAEIRKMREMISSSLENDQTFKDHETKAKEANKVKTATKSNLMKQPQNMETSHKLKTLVTETKEMEEALSDYLREYHRISGSSEIETNEGDVREIVYVAKLVKKSSRPK